MERLSDDLGLGCLASERVGDDMLMLAVTGPPQPFGSRVQVGERLPIAPPLGMAFIAWSDSATIDAYLDRAGRKLPAAERRQYLEALELVRDRGYGVVLDTATRRRLVTLMRTSRAARLMPDAITNSTRSWSNSRSTSTRSSLAATTPSMQSRPSPHRFFAPDGEVILVLTIVGFPSPLPAEQLPR